MEYTSTVLPRQNGRVEKKINLIWGRAMITMVRAKLKKETQVKLWSEVVNCRSFMENQILKVDQNESSMEAWTGDIVRNCFNLLVQLGGIGYVAKKDNIKGKITERAFTAIMVVYTEN